MLIALDVADITKKPFHNISQSSRYTQIKIVFDLLEL